MQSSTNAMPKDQKSPSGATPTTGATSEARAPNAALRGMSFAEGAASLSPGGALDRGGPSVQMMRASTGGRSGVVQGKFTGKLQAVAYADIHAQLVARFENVPAKWKVEQLARDGGSYGTIEEVAAALKLKPKADAPAPAPENGTPIEGAPTDRKDTPAPKDPPKEGTSDKPPTPPSAPTERQVNAPEQKTRLSDAPPRLGSSSDAAIDKTPPKAPPKTPLTPALTGPASPVTSTASNTHASAPKAPTEVHAEEKKVSAARFVVHKRGLCDYDKVITMSGSTDPVDLTRLYDENGKEQYVSEAALQDAITGCGWKQEPPKKAMKLINIARPVGPEQGLAQMFTCAHCGGQADAGDGCDWVPHDKQLGGCGANNVIANGDAHSRNNEAFRAAMRGLRADSKQSQIVATLAAHPKAASFWGLGDIATIINTVGRWAAIKAAAFFIHGDFTGFAAAMDKIAK